MTQIERRRRASELVCRIVLLIFRAAHTTYNRGRNLASVAPEMLVAMAIRARQMRTGRPVSIEEIFSMTTFPTSNLQRYCKVLLKEGLIIQPDPRWSIYLMNPDYYGARVNARHFYHIVRGIIAVAHELERLGFDEKNHFGSQ
jgi:hypothetical protein